MHRVRHAPRALAAAVVLLAACARGPAEEAPAAPAAIDNPTLGLRIAALPEGFAPAGGDLSRWAFGVRSGEVQGTATIELRPAASAAVNLVEEAKRFGEAAAAEPGGRFYGGNELVTPFGSAYTVRVLADRGLVEERVVFLLHPDGSNRLLLVSLRYPPGDNETARARLMQTLELVGALEPLPAA